MYIVVHLLVLRDGCESDDLDLTQVDATRFYDEDMLSRATEWKEGDESRPSSGIHRSLARDFDAVHQGQQAVVSRAAAPIEKASSSMHGPCMETEPEPEMESAEEPEPSSGVCGPMPLEVEAPEPSVVPSDGEDLLQVDGEPFIHQQQVDLRREKQEENRAARGGGRGRPSRGRGRGRGRKAAVASEHGEEDEDLVTPNARGAAVPEETPMDKASRTRRRAASEEPVPVEPKRAKAAAKKGAAKKMMKRPAAARRIAEEQPVDAEAIVPDADGTTEPRVPEPLDAEASMPDADGMPEPRVPEPLAAEASMPDADGMTEPRVPEPLADAEPDADGMIEPRVPEPLAEEGMEPSEEAPMGGDGILDVPEEVVAPRGRGRGRGRGRAAKGLSDENRKICKELPVCFKYCASRLPDVHFLSATLLSIYVYIFMYLFVYLFIHYI